MADDLNTILIKPLALATVDGEPRIRDADLAVMLGFTQVRDIRKIIQRNRREVDDFGCAPSWRETPKASGGRPSKGYLLNEEQALLVSVLSRAPNAPAVRAMLIKTFVAWRRRKLEAAYRKPALETPKLLPRRKSIRDRRDLSFTDLNADTPLSKRKNWIEPETRGQWHRHYGIGEAWFYEIVELSRHNPQEAYDAMKFAGPEMMRFFGLGHADGFFDQMAQWALRGILGRKDLSIRINAMGLPPTPSDRRFA